MWRGGKKGGRQSWAALNSGHRGSFQGERKQEKEEKGKKFHRIERLYGAFERSFTLPDGVDESKVTADFKEGMSNVHLPKTEKAKPKTIEVKAA